MRQRTAVFAGGLILATAFAGATSSTFAQSANREKPKLKDFGSSVKRLKWDPKTKAAVETKRPNEKAASADDVEVVRVETTLVVAQVMVLDQQGNAVNGLTPADFVVTEDGQAQQIGMLSLGDNVKVPRSVVLLIDYSGSQLPFIETSIAAAKTLVDKLGPLDTMAIVTDDVALLLDFTSDKHKLKDKLESLRKRTLPTKSLFGGSGFGRVGHSAQYSALMATLKEAFTNEDQRPIVIFQTDGDEAIFLRDSIITPSVPFGLPPDVQKGAEMAAESLRKSQLERVREFSLNDVYRTAEKSRATIYTVISGIQLIGFSPDEQDKRVKEEYNQRLQALIARSGGNFPEEIRKREEDRLSRMPSQMLRYITQQEFKVQSALNDLAPLTGGWTAFLEQPSQADEIYTRILSDINRRYVIGYYPTNKEHDGKRRKVLVEVRGHPEYTVMGRKSYFAPDPEP